jgi:DNA-binding response OmpR family regulator
LPQEFEAQIKTQINNILSKIYINNILNLTNFKIEHSTNFRKPFAINNLLNYIHEKTKDNSLFIYLNNSFLYDEIASKIEHDFNTANLTSKENKILKFMLGNKDYKSNKLELSEKIWGHNREVDSSTVEYHMYKLKNKLPSDFLVIQGFDYFLKILS